MAESDTAEALARKRWLAINLIRIAGVIMILIGLGVANDALDWPDWSAYILIGIGMFDVFFFPVILSRRWSDKRKS